VSENAVDRGDSLELNNTAAEDAAAETKVAASAAEETKVEAPATEEAKPVETKEEAPRDDKGRFIPQSRFNEVVAKERGAREQAERELAELKAQMAQVSKSADMEKIEAEIIELEKAKAKALLDGDVDKVAELAGQIRVKDETVRISKQENVPERIKEEMREELRWESTIEKLEGTYPQLKAGGEKYDQDIVDMVLATQSVYVNEKRMTPSAALLSAAEKVMAKIMPAATDGVKSEGLDAGKDVVADREKKQIEKNLDTIKKQPADMSDAGLDSDKAGMTKDIDVRKLSSAEFAALPDATKARLRGDMI
jgi:hypothetical protein